MYTLKILCSNCGYVENSMEVDTQKYDVFNLHLNATPCIKCAFLQKMAHLEKQHQAEGSSSPANFDESLQWAAGALERAHRPVTAANLCEVLGDQVNEHQAQQWLDERGK